MSKFYTGIIEDIIEDKVIIDFGLDKEKDCVLIFPMEDFDFDFHKLQWVAIEIDKEDYAIRVFDLDKKPLDVLELLIVREYNRETYLQTVSLLDREEQASGNL